MGSMALGLFATLLIGTILETLGQYTGWALLTEIAGYAKSCTGAALGAAMWAKGLWRGAGVFNVEEFDPDPFLAELGEQGLPWHELFDVNLEV